MISSMVAAIAAALNASTDCLGCAAEAAKKNLKAHKKGVHSTALLVIGFGLSHEGAGIADWTFLVLAMLCEID